MKWLMSALLAGALALGGWAYVAYRTHHDAALFANGAPVRVSVESGTGIRQLARELQRQGLISRPRVFVWLARLDGSAGQLRAGVYEVRPGMSANDLLGAISRGEAIQEQVRFIEGWTFRQFRSALDTHPGIRHDTKDLSETALLERVGAIEKRAEGLFFPDSYRFAPGTSDLVVLRQAYARMRKVLETAWSARATDSPLLSAYDALILASIIEKETGRAEDRPLIGSVFNNRLRIGMRLQSDPTVIYGMGSAFDGNLRRIHLDTDSPYNTYTRAGLPPTPIAAPGAASVEAALSPAESRALYFVARGDGTSQFSLNLADHNRAVARFQKR